MQNRLVVRIIVHIVRRGVIDLCCYLFVCFPGNFVHCISFIYRTLDCKKHANERLTRRTQYVNDALLYPLFSKIVYFLLNRVFLYVYVYVCVLCVCVFLRVCLFVCLFVHFSCVYGLLFHCPCGTCEFGRAVLGAAVNCFEPHPFFSLLSRSLS